MVDQCTEATTVEIQPRFINTRKTQHILMNKIILGLVAAAAVAAPIALTAGSANAAGGAQHNDDPTGKTFTFWDGNGHLPGDYAHNYVTTSYHDVVTPNGSETEVFKGVIARHRRRGRLHRGRRPGARGPAVWQLCHEPHHTGLAEYDQRVRQVHVDLPLPKLEVTAKGQAGAVRRRVQPRIACRGESIRRVGHSRHNCRSASATAVWS